ncbi:ABC transporter ATP-binding protein [Bradyrhizobium sp.]|uniref:ABC transporter ATP-binding protein n=1 Tax=Bradyrhizobium sp. TaxID=376 RepID=UPI003C1FC27C
MIALLDVSDLDAGYGPVQVLKRVQLSVRENSITAMIGSNGAGKTTTMRTLAGLLAPSYGRIAFAGEDITFTPTNARVANGLTLVPEGRLVFPDFTVEETLRIGAYSPRAHVGADVRSAEMYELFPRLRERRSVRAGSLSGGEQQMLAIARGLMSAPRLLLLDEPSLGLAPSTAEMLFEIIVEIRRRGITVCLVEQDVHSTLEISDYAYVLEDGQIVAEGPARELLSSPRVRESYLGL